MSDPSNKRSKTEDTIELYSYWRSSCSWRVRIGLSLKKIDYVYHPVHLVKDGGEQLKEDYVALNEMKQVPLLCIDGIKLTQSVAILEYLEDRDPTNSFFPKDDIKAKADVRKMVEIINSGIQPLQNLAVLKKIVALGGDKLAWGKEVIENGFNALEKAIAKRERKEGDYCVGNTITLADIFLVPQVYNANRFGVDMSKYPLISDIDNRLKELEVFKNASAESQPDAQN